jgi:hypothetical protein
MSSSTDPKSERRLRVFLCHASGDKPIVRDLYDRLTVAGFDPWLDEKNLLPGQEWQREIAKAVKSSDVVIVCLSRGAVTKEGYIQKELKLALDVADEQPEATFYIIPLRLDESPVPDRLKQWQWVSLFEASGYETLIKSLSRRAATIFSSGTPESVTDPFASLQRSITLAQRELIRLEQQAMGYSVLTLPFDIALKLDEKRKEIDRLEIASSRSQGHKTLQQDSRVSPSNSYDIFLSYSREDVSIMLRIKSDLQLNGFNVWVDESDIEPGTPTWEAAIQGAIENSPCMVVIMSPDSKHSKWVIREISYAELHNVRIFPVLARGNELDAVPVRLSTTMWVDIRSDYSKTIQRLITAIRKQIGIQTPLSNP